jgi:hypothetical protein
VEEKVAQDTVWRNEGGNGGDDWNEQGDARAAL